MGEVTKTQCCPQKFAKGAGNLSSKELNVPRFNFLTFMTLDDP